MSGPWEITKWRCDQCEKVIEIESKYRSEIPDERGWTRITLANCFRSTGRFGLVMKHEPQERLVCSLECAQAVLADRWKWMW